MASMDDHLIRSICFDAVEKGTHASVLFPHITYGNTRFSEKFPDGITVGIEKVTASVVTLISTIVENGFKRILIIGTDTPLIMFIAEQAARATHALCGAVHWTRLLEDAVNGGPPYRPFLWLNQAYSWRGSALRPVNILNTPSSANEFPVARLNDADAAEATYDSCVKRVLEMIQILQGTRHAYTGR